MEPSCFCSLATNSAKYDTKLFLLSLSYFNPGSNVVLFVDDVIENFIHSDTELNSLDLKLELVVKLNDYTNKDRNQMEGDGIWNKFMLIKADVIDYCLNKFPDVLFLDSDIFLLHKFTMPIDKNEYDLVLSPHYIGKWLSDRVGYFNGGFVWTSNKLFTERWREHTVHSRYFEQASLENCAEEFKTFHLAENYNFSWWRLDYSDENSTTIQSYITYDDENIYYKQLPLIFVHTHFNQASLNNFNQLIISTLENIPNKSYLLKLLTT